MPRPTTQTYEAELVRRARIYANWGLTHSVSPTIGFNQQIFGGDEQVRGLDLSG